MTLSEYLRNRGLNLDPIEIDKEIDPIMQDEALIREAAELWESKSALISLVIQARINSIGKQILNKCTPEEVLVLRQAIVELGAIISDFNAYKSEHSRRKTKNNKEEVPPEPLKEGKEGSL